ncbi:uncharacterized protein LOC143376087 isoform X2 [Andrena cerasifolii]|uniref:uncharacterized protein LOC143376087 isoform X2 n=1 Tax=Andrena cerasifolii TaxID=2819439 RepID=UPI00403773DD
MANENETTPDVQSEELRAWISSIPFSKPKRNLKRDFSDAVLMAEVLKIYYPRIVDLHNYIPASSLTTKKDNWNMLNRKVLCKIDMKLSKDAIHQLASSEPGAAERMLLDLKSRVLKNFEHQNPENSENPLCNDGERDAVEGGKLDQHIANAETEETSVSRSTDQLALNTLNSSVFLRAKEKLFLILQWIISWLCVWNYLPTVKTRSSKNSAQAGAGASTTQSAPVYNKVEDAIPRHICAQLGRKLHEMDDIISSLNHKVAYLESVMKLKDLRISNLTSQILQNAVESEQLGKVQTNNDAQANNKPRPRSQNIRERVKMEE